MSMLYIRCHYRVPAKRGMRIRYLPMSKKGVIVGSKDAYIRVRFDGEKIVRTLHPTWCVKYLKPQKPKRYLTDCDMK